MNDDFSRALLVVDMQNGFCHPDGSMPRIGMGLEGAQAAVDNAAIAVRQARHARIPVIFTRHLYRPGRADEGRSLVTTSPTLAGIDGLAAGTWDAEVVTELGCGPEDLLVDKVRFDAFQWTSLEPLLRGLGVDDLVVCGVVTNLCVETTVRSAFMRDYSVTLLADCCAAKTRRLHDLSLEVLGSYQLAAIAAVGDGFEVGRTGESSAQTAQLGLSPLRLPQREVLACRCGPGPEDPPVLLLDRDVVDAGLAPGHQAVGVELPQFVAVAAEPLAGPVVAFVLEAHGDVVAVEGPQFLPQRVVEFAFPLGRQELHDGVAPGDERVAVTPHRVLGIGQRDLLGVAGVPRVLGGLDLLARGLLGERGQWRPSAHRKS
jgi:ureidoacrylate peracid hydrolase